MLILFVSHFFDAFIYPTYYDVDDVLLNCHPCGFFKHIIIHEVELCANERVTKAMLRPVYRCLLIPPSSVSEWVSEAKVVCILLPRWFYYRHEATRIFAWCMKWNASTVAYGIKLIWHYESL